MTWGTFSHELQTMSRKSGSDVVLDVARSHTGHATWDCPPQKRSHLLETLRLVSVRGGAWVQRAGGRTWRYELFTSCSQRRPLRHSKFPNLIVSPVRPFHWRLYVTDPSPSSSPADVCVLPGLLQSHDRNVSQSFAFSHTAPPGIVEISSGLRCISKSALCKDFILFLAVEILSLSVSLFFVPAN